MRSLITGGRGFVGTWLARYLSEQGDEVSAIDLETDISDAEALAPVVAAAAPEAIYHLAAMTHVGESWERPAQVLSTNVIGTANVLAAARQVDSNPVVLVISSAEVYGAVSKDLLPIDEDAPLAPLTPYAASKAAAEQLALQAFRGYGQPVVVARPFNHIGPGQAPNFAVSALAKRIVEAKRSGSWELSVGTLTTRRDFCDVRDVVRAYRLMIQHGERGAIYNVASGEDHEIGDIAGRLLRLAEADLHLVTDESLVRPVDVPVLRGNASKLAAATAWKPEIVLDDTLRDVLSYWESASAT